MNARARAVRPLRKSHLLSPRVTMICNMKRTLFVCRPLRGRTPTKECAEWIEKRDALVKRWTNHRLYDPKKTWSVCAKISDKITMALEAHAELGWNIYDFDSKMESRNQKKRSLALSSPPRPPHVSLYMLITCTGPRNATASASGRWCLRSVPLSFSPSLYVLYCVLLSCPRSFRRRFVSPLLFYVFFGLPTSALQADVGTTLFSRRTRRILIPALSLRPRRR